MARGPSCPTPCWIPVPDQGLNRRPLHCKVDSLPLDHQGSPFTASSFKWVIKSSLPQKMSRVIVGFMPIRCLAQHLAHAKHSVNIFCCYHWGLGNVHFPPCDESFSTWARPVISFSRLMSAMAHNLPQQPGSLKYFDGITQKVFLVLSPAIVL